MSDTHYIIYKGEKKSLSEWARVFNINKNTLSSRINTYRWDIEKAFNFPVRNRGW